MIEAWLYQVDQALAGFLGGRLGPHPISQHVVGHLLRFLASAPVQPQSLLQHADVGEVGLVEPINIMEEEIKMGVVGDRESQDTIQSLP